MSDKSYELILRTLLATELLGDLQPVLKTLSASELAHAFVANALLASVIQCVDDERWIRKQTSTTEISVPDFLKGVLQTDLAVAVFTRAFLEDLAPDAIRIAKKNAKRIDQAIISCAKAMAPLTKNAFAGTCFQLMSELFEFEHRMHVEKNALASHFVLSLHTTFDRLDELFDFDYEADREMITRPDEKQRLYEGSGVGVQSNYAAILIALRHLNPERSSRFIDLGSGYGRVGLVVGLLRPDIDFIGYEYVNHRVESAALASSNLGLVGHVAFNTQDLAATDFQIPVAETYYIYDSFTKSTYEHVLARLAEIARQQPIAIVTKGNARQWLEAPELQKYWQLDEHFDHGNLCVFRSGSR